MVTKEKEVSKSFEYIARVRNSGDSIKIPSDMIKKLKIKPKSYLKVKIEIIE